MNVCDMEKSAEAYFRSMADDLDPYPGNLKKHEVKPEYVKIPEAYKLSLSFPIDPELEKEMDAFCKELAQDMIDAHKSYPMTINDPMPLPPCGHGYINGLPCQCSSGGQATNDPQAKYGDTLEEKIGPSGLTAKRLQELCKAQQREPLLSVDEMMQGSWENRHISGNVLDGFGRGAIWAEKTIRAKITSGELRVVKKVEPRITPFRHISGNVHPESLCPDCGVNLAPYGIGSEFNYFNFCPGCGARIIE